MNRPTSLKMT